MDCPLSTVQSLTGLSSALLNNVLKSHAILALRLRTSHRHEIMLCASSDWYPGDFSDSLTHRTLFCAEGSEPKFIFQRPGSRSTGSID